VENNAHKKVYKTIVLYYIQNIHQHNTDDCGQAMGEKLRQVQMGTGHLKQAYRWRKRTRI